MKVRCLLLLLTLVFAGVSGSCSGPDPGPPVAREVRIHEAVGGGESLTSTTIRDPEFVARIEALFPEYHTRPEGGPPAGWAAEYTLSFLLPGGETVEVLCGSEGKLWSVGEGKGDLAVAGDLRELLDSLR